MDRQQEAAQLLLSARRHHANRLPELPPMVRPVTAEQAYLIQRGIMRELGEIGGWKVGSPSPTGGFTCAPLPARGIVIGPATADGLDRGVEAEIAVRLGKALPVQGGPYAEAEILAAIASAHPAIEVLHSRYLDPDKVEPFSNLADSLSHQGLVLGPAIDGWQSIDLAAEDVRLLVDGTEVKRRTGNPAGGMLRLLLWLANTGAAWAGGLRAGQVVTTGSWTGKDTIPPGGTAEIVFDHCGACSVSFPT